MPLAMSRIAGASEVETTCVASASTVVLRSAE